MRVLLVRYGLPTAIPGAARHAAGLSQQGRSQMQAAGCWIDAFFSEIHRAPGPRPRVRLWTGPDRCARESGRALQEAASAWIVERREHLLLGGQQLGLFEGVPEHAREAEFPGAFARHARREATQGRFWARYPAGESRFDVARRVHQAFADLRRANSERGKFGNPDALVVVCDAVTMLAFVMMWCERTPEWFESEPTPKCGAIRHLDDARDRGYIFEGF